VLNDSSLLGLRVATCRKAVLGALSPYGAKRMASDYKSVLQDP